MKFYLLISKIFCKYYLKDVKKEKLMQLERRNSEELLNIFQLEQRLLVLVSFQGVDSKNNENSKKFHLMLPQE